jgi:hypothetical protein
MADFDEVTDECHRTLAAFVSRYSIAFLLRDACQVCRRPAPRSQVMTFMSSEVYTRQR